jgi:hypothetical protein
MSAMAGQIVPVGKDVPTRDSDDDDDDVPLKRRKVCGASGKIQIGAYVSRIIYGKIVSVFGSSVTVENENGVRKTVSRSLVEEHAFVTGGQPDTVRIVSVNELACILRNDVRDKVFAFTYTKESTPEDDDRILANAKLHTPANRKKVANLLRQGQKYSVGGAHIVSFNELGSMRVNDLECKVERTVDIKTITSVSVGSNGYMVRK